MVGTWLPRPNTLLDAVSAAAMAATQSLSNPLPLNENPAPPGPLWPSVDPVRFRAPTKILTVFAAEVNVVSSFEPPVEGVGIGEPPVEGNICVIHSPGHPFRFRG